MDFESYQSEIRAIDAQINEVKAAIRKLKEQIAETEAAANSSRKLRGEFEEFVARRKTSMERPTKGINLKMFTGFVNKATSLLTGSDYWRTIDQIEEMNRLMKRKLAVYDDDLDYCERELRQLNKQKEMIMAEYRLASQDLDEGGQ